MTLPESQALGRWSWVPSLLLGSCFWTQFRETLTSHRLVGGSCWLCQYHLPPGVPKSSNTQACTASGPQGAERDTSHPDSEEGKAHTSSSCLVPGWATSSGSDPGRRGREEDMDRAVSFVTKAHSSSLTSPSCYYHGPLVPPQDLKDHHYATFTPHLSSPRLIFPTDRAASDNT